MNTEEVRVSNKGRINQYTCEVWFEDIPIMTLVRRLETEK